MPISKKSDLKKLKVAELKKIIKQNKLGPVSKKTKVELISMIIEADNYKDIASKIEMPEKRKVSQKTKDALKAGRVKRCAATKKEMEPVVEEKPVVVEEAPVEEIDQDFETLKMLIQRKFSLNFIDKETEAQFKDFYTKNKGLSFTQMLDKIQREFFDEMPQEEVRPIEIPKPELKPVYVEPVVMPMAAPLVSTTPLSNTMNRIRDLIIPESLKPVNKPPPEDTGVDTTEDQSSLQKVATQVKSAKPPGIASIFGKRKNKRKKKKSVFKF